jgi:hypothetical protein
MKSYLQSEEQLLLMTEISVNINFSSTSIPLVIYKKIAIRSKTMYVLNALFLIDILVFNPKSEPIHQIN